jgi:hypothetical protein
MKAQDIESLAIFLEAMNKGDFTKLKTPIESCKSSLAFFFFFNLKNLIFNLLGAINFNT